MYGAFIIIYMRDGEGDEVVPIMAREGDGDLGAGCLFDRGSLLPEPDDEPAPPAGVPVSTEVYDILADGAPTAVPGRIGEADVIAHEEYAKFVADTVANVLDSEYSHVPFGGDLRARLLRSFLGLPKRIDSPEHISAFVRLFVADLIERMEKHSKKFLLISWSRRDGTEGVVEFFKRRGDPLPLIDVCRQDGSVTITPRLQDFTAAFAKEVIARINEVFVPDAEDLFGSDLLVEFSIIEGVYPDSLPAGVSMKLVEDFIATARESGRPFEIQHVLEILRRFPNNTAARQALLTYLETGKLWTRIRDYGTEAQTGRFLEWQPGMPSVLYCRDGRLFTVERDERNLIISSTEWKPR